MRASSVFFLHKFIVNFASNTYQLTNKVVANSASNTCLLHFKFVCFYPNVKICVKYTAISTTFAHQIRRDLNTIHQLYNKWHINWASNLTYLKAQVCHNPNATHLGRNKLSCECSNKLIFFIVHLLQYTMC